MNHDLRTELATIFFGCLIFTMLIIGIVLIALEALHVFR